MKQTNEYKYTSKVSGRITRYYLTNPAGKQVKFAESRLLGRCWNVTKFSPFGFETITSATYEPNEVIDLVDVAAANLADDINEGLYCPNVVGMISKETADLWRARMDAYEAKSKEIRLSRGARCNWITSAESEQCAAYAGGEVTNEMRSKVEQYDFANSIPEKYVAYYDPKNAVVKTWMGDVIGEVRFKSKNGFDMVGINGHFYRGRFWPNAGDYCRLVLIL